MIEEDGPDERYVPHDAKSINHPVVDLDYILMYPGNLRTRASSQAQTLLRQGRFLVWMSQANPDLILVNANIRSVGEERISAMSILCADLVGCLATTRPEDIIVHFFCGLDSNYDDEPFPGPAGVVRSLILQVFLKLASREHLSLDFSPRPEHAGSLTDSQPGGHVLHAPRVAARFPSRHAGVLYHRLDLDA